MKQIPLLNMEINIVSFLSSIISILPDVINGRKSKCCILTYFCTHLEILKSLNIWTLYDKVYREICITHQNGVGYQYILHTLWNAGWNWGKKKRVSILTIRNWGNQVRGVMVLKRFEGEKAIALHRGFLIEKVDRLFLEVNGGKRL